jgi:hypothetical protein
MMLLPAWVRKSGAKILQSKANRNTSLMAEREFRLEAARERVRADRNRLPLSIMVIELPADRASARNFAFLGKTLERRLRLTDIAGRLDDERVAVLLPDTSKAGAWKVAGDVCELYPVGRERPNCEVYVYSDEGLLRGGESTEASDQPANGLFAQFDSLLAGMYVTSDRS